MHPTTLLRLTTCLALAGALSFTLPEAHGEEARILRLGVTSGAKQVPFRLLNDGEVVRHGTIEWGGDKSELEFGIDVAPFSGKLELMVGEEAVEPRFVKSLAGEETLYREPLRPQLHFSPARGWLNDPNGLVFHKGKWHMFYQHNPYGAKWGNMHWGHAVSSDLLHWEEKPIALRPIYQGPKSRDSAFSGTAFFDSENSLKLKDGPALVAAYTSTGRGECLAYSHDEGLTWSDYEHNPVLVHGKSNTGTPGDDGYWHDSRDPKVFRYQENGEDHWVMVVYEQNEPDKKTAEGVTFAIYISEDLRNWERTQVLEGWYECSDLFPLPVDGDKENTKWVLLEAHGYYVLGSFDGKTFTADPRVGTSDKVENSFRPYIVSAEKYSGAHGNGYAGQTWNDVPKGDGRRLLTTWVRATPPGISIFSQAMSLPTELSLKTTDDGVRLHYAPLRELKKLHGRSIVENLSASGAELNETMKKITGSPTRISGRVKFDVSGKSGLEIHGYDLHYDPATGLLGKLPVLLTDGEADLDIIVDQGCIEVFVNGGRHYGVFEHFFTPEKVGVTAKNLQVEGLTVVELNSIWK